MAKKTDEKTVNIVYILLNYRDILKSTRNSGSLF